jgi:para-aminobenzoate synthetase component 1
VPDIAALAAVPPLRSAPLPWRDPVDVYRALAPRFRDLVLLDRGNALRERRSFVGVPADGPLVLAPDLGGDPLMTVLAALRAPLDAERTDSDRLGWWGWLGYELGVAGLGLPVPEIDAPPAAFLFAAAGVEFDHDAGTVTAIALPGHEALLRDLVHHLAEPVVLHPARAAARVVAPARRRHGRERYLQLVEACRRAIAAGDAYQLCLTDRIEVELAAPADEAALHERLRDRYPVRNGGIVRIRGWTLVSGSPEEFLAVDGAGHARTRPMKGTRPRDADPAVDRALARELVASEKERAENLMIVDLMRNDLARVAEVGSVAVTELFGVEHYPAVHQLVSTVEADLAGDPLDAVRSLFPAGSMTGAPKHAAVRILAGLEGGPRGVYSGVWGRVSVDRTIDLSVVIRSIVLHGTTATIGTGGGVTILSDPAEEWRETEVKAAALLDVLGAGL